MAETKQYISQAQENGNVLISEDVIATIVSHAVSEVEGVAGLGSIPKRAWGKGVKITISPNNKLTIECYVIVYYGQSVFDVAKAVQVAIGNAIQAMTGAKVNSINVNVSGIIRKDK